MVRLIKDNVNLDFVRAGRFLTWVSLALVLLSVGSLASRGMNTGIDFVGGTVLEFQCGNKTVSVSDIRTASHSVLTNSMVYSAGNDVFIVKARSAENEEMTSLKRALSERCGDNIQYRSAAYVGPQVSRDIIFSGLGAILLAMLGVFAYLCMRFNLCFALSGIVTLAHDVILLFGFYSLTSIEFNLSSVAAVLTIVGYSINDSVVIYDRIRGNFKLSGDSGLEQMINNSVNGTLSRTLFTSLTTFLASAVLVALGGEVIRSFSWAVMFGIIVGTYSSIIISTQCLLWGRNMNVLRIA